MMDAPDELRQTVEQALRGCLDARTVVMDGEWRYMAGVVLAVPAIADALAAMNDAESVEWAVEMGSGRYDEIPASWVKDGPLTARGVPLPLFRRTVRRGPWAAALYPETGK